VDYGTDDYAGSTWSGGKPGDERQLFLGWMSNWQYGAQEPTKPWRSAMTLPRELRLVDGPGGAELRSLPVAELAALRGSTTPVAAAKAVRDIELAPHSPGAPAGLREVELRLRTRDATLVELKFGNAGGERTVFRINKAEHRYEVDRSASGAVDFNPVFARLQTAPLAGSAASVAIHAYVDRSSVELFIDDGATVFTTGVFPSAPYDKITLSADRDIAIDSGAVHELKSIWQTH
jgi:sucrose-6-phosphate hydrolase SacC (GH32 family)